MKRSTTLARPLATALVTLVSLAAGSTAQAEAAQPPNLRVEGTRMVDDAGTPTRVAGVNRSGAEYACAQGWGIFDGPTDDASIAAIGSWGVNAVRVPLNEDCWLDINGVNRSYSGSVYRAAIRGYVDRLHARGLAVILDLHWSAPGTKLALGQEHAPDADHAPAFWRSVATEYRDVGGIAFDLFNEPHDISWSCWRDGCTTAEGWQATGVQQLVDVVRGAGARQPVIAEGLNWGGDLSGWLANRPSDPAGQLVAGWHIYNFSGCNTTACWDQTVAPVARRVPVIATEIGENDCAHSFLDTLLPWADARGIGYVGWSWNAASCGGGPALIADYAGTPTAFGAGYKAHLDRTAGSHPIDDAARFDFEAGGTDGWSVRWGNTLQVANAAGTAWSGSHGLALDVTGTGYPAVGTGTGLTGVAPGTVVTYRLWAPAGVSAGVAPMLFDDRWNVSVLSDQHLVAGWNTVTFTIPSGVTGVRVMGLQVNDGSDWRGRLVLDDVTWQPVRFDFEDGTTQGWSLRWGSTVSVANQADRAFTGARGLALDVSGSGYPAIGAAPIGASLAPGAPVTYRIWAPAGVAADVAPMFFDDRWNVSVLRGQHLEAGWNAVSFTIPSGVEGVRILGLQINDGTGWTGRLVLDSVAY